MIDDATKDKIIAVVLATMPSACGRSHEYEVEAARDFLRSGFCPADIPLNLGMRHVKAWLANCNALRQDIAFVRAVRKELIIESLRIATRGAPRFIGR